MADHVPSQGNFIGWLALGLMAFALAVALFVTLAGMSVPPS
jgi:hypothetical protein